MPTVGLSLLACFAFASPPTARAESPTTRPAIVVADFEDKLPASLHVEGFVAAMAAHAAVGHGALRLKPATQPAKIPQWWIDINGIDPQTAGEISMQVRTPGKETEVIVRILASDADGRRLYQRRVKLAAGEAWQPIHLSLGELRWGAFVGSWGEVRRLGFALESPADEIGVDDVKILPRTEAAGEAVKRLAFAEKSSAVAQAEGVLVGTSASADKQIKADDLTHTLTHVQRARAMLKRLFADADRPIDEPTPVSLLIFSDADEMKDFWKRQGAAWSAQIEAPTSGGYTVQDIATSTFVAKIGPDRPVYLHEAVHALISHDLRLSVSDDSHWWLHEGLANYVQLCVYPKSLDNKTYPNEFATGVDPKSDGLFIPLKTLLTRRGMSNNYAQLASVIAYLADEQPALLPPIANALANHRDLGDTLKAANTDWDKLQADWLKWGRKKFKSPLPEGAPQFALPKEWSEAK